MPKYANVDFAVCDPFACDPRRGACPAASACTKGLMEQEEPYDAPSLLSSRLCSGCSGCAKACPLGAIRIVQGL